MKCRYYLERDTNRAKLKKALLAVPKNMDPP